MSGLFVFAPGFERRAALRALRRPLRLAAVSIALLVVQVLLVRVAAESHAAHALLGAGNGPPPLFPALLAVTLVVVRLLAVVVVPGALLAALAEIAAYCVAGERER